MRSEILTEAAQGADSFPTSIVMSRMYEFRVTNGLSRHGSSTRRHPFIETGGKSGSDCMCCSFLYIEPVPILFDQTSYIARFSV